MLGVFSKNSKKTVHKMSLIFRLTSVPLNVSRFDEAHRDTTCQKSQINIRSNAQALRRISSHSFAGSLS